MCAGGEFYALARCQRLGQSFGDCRATIAVLEKKIDLSLLKSKQRQPMQQDKDDCTIPKTKTTKLYEQSSNIKEQSIYTAIL
ncbi:hypothetical protein NHP200010_00830 [Helicobacter bizzozeronii]|nr:hypothetical protein NHP200010_00830 [Helicobacter bizzozeronii]